MFANPLLALALVQLAVACPGDDHAHAHVRREFPQIALPVPTRPLVWGDVNVIHTTDTHGWLLGHQKLSEPEPNYSGDLGDFASFVAHMKQLALEKDVDLLLVDTGDVHDGTGLSDGFPPGQLDAHASNQFIKELPYDLLSIGNHELSDGYDVALDMFTDFAPFWKGRYLSSNVNITIFDENNNTVSVPVGERFVKFTTGKGRRVTSLGVLFDFTGNAENTTVQTVANMVKEEWFAEAIQEEPDFFLLIGHMPVSRDNWPTVFNAVRAVHPTTPILIFGGHTHIRDCLQFDGRSMALESGRYMETIGWMSVDLDEANPNKKANLSFTRRYLDQNRVSYEFHSLQNNRTFDTPLGQQVTSGLLALAQSFDLNEVFGIAPQDFFLDRAPFPSNSSVLSLLVDQAAPIALAINNTRAEAGIPSIILTNSGELRFDVLAGPFTKNDQFTALPFADAFVFIPEVPVAIAEAVLPELNNEGADEKKRALGSERNLERYKRGDVSMVYRAWMRAMAEAAGTLERRAEANLTLGYVTTDACPGVGDDIPHSALPFFSTPDFIGSAAPESASGSGSSSANATVDLVFINFIQDQTIPALNKVSAAMGGRNYSDADVQSYTPILANQIFELFAAAVWNS